MELTGKCKKDFEKWYYDNNILGSEDIGCHIKYFYDLHNSMKYGVFVDFFDEVNVPVDDIYEREEFMIYAMYQDRNNHRPEVRTATIEKANQIYNER